MGKRRNHMRKLLRHKKALSPVVAAIILIAVTVAVSIAVAAWMGALTIGFMGTEELRILSVTFSDTPGTSITVENTGTVTVVVVDVKIGGTTRVAEGYKQEITAGSGPQVIPTNFGAWQPGTAYDIQVITAKGNVFSYRAYAPQ